MRVRAVCASSYRDFRNCDACVAHSIGLRSRATQASQLRTFVPSLLLCLLPGFILSGFCNADPAPATSQPARSEAAQHLVGLLHDYHGVEGQTLYHARHELMNVINRDELSLFELLSDPDPQVRRDDLFFLESIPPRHLIEDQAAFVRAIPFLAEEVKSTDDIHIRQNAAYHLRYAGTDGVVALIDLLQSDDPQIVQWAANAISFSLQRRGARNEPPLEMNRLKLAVDPVIPRISRMLRIDPAPTANSQPSSYSAATYDRATKTGISPGEIEELINLLGLGSKPSDVLVYSSNLPFNPQAVPKLSMLIGTMPAGSDRDRALLTLAGQITPDVAWAVYREINKYSDRNGEYVEQGLGSSDPTIARGGVMLLSAAGEQPPSPDQLDRLIQISTHADPPMLSAIAGIVAHTPADQFAGYVHTALFGSGDAQTKAGRLLELAALNPEPAPDAVDPISRQNAPPVLTFVGGSVRKLILNSPDFGDLRGMTATWMLEPWHSSTGPVTRDLAVRIVRQTKGSDDPHVFYLGNSVTVDPSLPWLPMAVTVPAAAPLATGLHFGMRQVLVLFTIGLSAFLLLTTAVYWSLRYPDHL